MAEMRAEVRGTQELHARLQSLGRDLATVVTQKALEAGAAVMTAEVQRTTPRREGTLASRLTSAVTVAPSGEAGEARIGFGAQDYKARWVEFGHRLVVGKGGKAKQVGRVSAHPFMRPAYESAKGQAQEAIATSYREQLQRVKK